MIIRNFLSDFLKLSKFQKFAILFIGFCIVWVVGNGTYSAVHQNFVKYKIIEDESESNLYSNYAFLKPNEKNIDTDIAGETNILIEHGSKVAKNHAIFSVAYVDDSSDKKKNKDKFFYANDSGLVSYAIDGYENLEKTNEVNKIDFSGLYSKQKKEPKPSRTVKKGETYVKIIDNIKPTKLYLKYIADENHIFNDVGDEFTISFPEFQEKTYGKVEEIVNLGNKEKIAKITVGPVSDRILLKRVVKVDLYKIQEAYMKLDKRILVYKNGEAGVYVSNNHFIEWQKIKVADETVDSIICQSLPRGSVVILTPELVKEGDFFKKG